MFTPPVNVNSPLDYHVKSSTGNTSFLINKASRIKIPLLSFFSGAGFLDIGFIRNNFDIVWRNEYNL